MGACCIGVPFGSTQINISSCDIGFLDMRQCATAQRDGQRNGPLSEVETKETSPSKTSSVLFQSHPTRRASSWLGALGMASFSRSWRTRDRPLEAVVFSCKRSSWTPNRPSLFRSKRSILTTEFEEVARTSTKRPAAGTFNGVQLLRALC